MVPNWIEPRDVSVPEALNNFVGGHALVAQVLARRGIKDIEKAQSFLDPAYYTPSPPNELPDLNKGVTRLGQGIRQGELILVWGDFDVDGQTSTALLVETLRDLGAQATHHIPVRKKESHGINLSALKRFIDKGVDLILTCDTGVANHESIAHAQSKGVDVVVTDHHTLPDTLPEAHAVVNPQRLHLSHPLRNLPGVGVAYKLAEALYKRAGQGEKAEKLLDLVALGIVADIAVQRMDTRYLLQRGIRALRSTQRPGLQELMKIAELDPSQLTEEHIAFVIAPRMNALGRLGDANIIVDFLTTDQRVGIIANQLEGLNARRKLLTSQIFQAAQSQIDRDPSLLDQAALVLSHPEWHAGVIGIVASRLVERYHRPTVLIAAPEGEVARGSARSIEGIDITAAISANKEILDGFGGHPMAAGLSIHPERIPAFKNALSSTVEAMIAGKAFKPTLHIDGYLSLEDISLALVEDLERLAPFGPGNPPLTLVSRGLTLVSSREIGRTGEHLQLLVENEEGITQRVVWWQGAGWQLPEGRFDLAYTLRASNYRGEREVQVEWIDFRPAEDPAAALRTPLQEVQVIDYRGESSPLQRLKQLQQEEENLLIWSEGEEKKIVEGASREEMNQSPSIAIWTSPPGPRELRAVLEKVTPDRVYLFNTDPHTDVLEEFVNRLAGLLKHVWVARGGRVSLSSLASATAQREATVQVGLACLEEKGLFNFRIENGIAQVEKGDRKENPNLNAIIKELSRLLAETAAYRAYYARANTEAVIR